MTVVEVSLALAVGAMVLLAAGALLAATVGPFNSLVARGATVGEMRDLRRSLGADLQLASCCPVVPDLSPGWQPAGGPTLPGDNLVRVVLPAAEISWRIRPIAPNRGSEVLRVVGRDGQWTWRVVLSGVDTLVPAIPMPATGEPWAWMLTPAATSANGSSTPVMLVLRALGEP